MGYIVDCKIKKYRNTYLYSRKCNACSEEYFFDPSEAENKGIFVCESCTPVIPLGAEYVDGVNGLYVTAWENQIALTERDKKQQRHSKKNYKKVFQRDQFVCQYCYGPGESIDHIKPIFVGGTNTLDNLVCACLKCNNIAGHLLFPNFWQKRMYIMKRTKILS